MALYISNLTSSPVVVTISTGIFTIPGNQSYNATAELASATSGDYTTLDAFRAAGTLGFKWSGVPEYQTSGLNILNVYVTLTVATLALLAAAPNPNGVALAQVQTNLCFYIFDPISTLTADGVNIIAPSSGNGRWLRQYWGHGFWLSQGTWFIDPVSGNDENLGTTNVTAIKTAAEFRARTGSLRPRFNQDTVIWIMNSLPTTDPFVPIFESAGHQIRVRGVRTVYRTSTVTASVVQSGTTQTGVTLKDTSVSSWTADVDNVVMGLTSLFAAWVESDQGSNTARISYPAKFTNLSAGNFSLNAFTVGETYQIATLPHITIGDVNLTGGGASAAPQLVFDGLIFDSFNTRSSNEIRTLASDVLCYDCKFTTQVNTEVFDYYNCNFTQGLVLRGGRVAIIGGLFRSSVQITSAAPQLILTLHVGTGAGVSVLQGSSPLVAGMCIFGVTGNGVSVSGRSNFGITSGFGDLVGSGNTGYGVALNGCSCMTISTSATLFLTGTSGNFSMEGSNSVRSLNSTTGAVLGPFTTSWTNLRAAQSSSGFGNFIFDIASANTVVSS